jgi:hypothetical protein
MQSVERCGEGLLETVAPVETGGMNAGKSAMSGHGTSRRFAAP